MNIKEYALINNITEFVARARFRKGKILNSCMDIQTKTILILEDQKYPEEIVRKTRKYEIDENVFLSENALSYYLLGAYMSDGNIYIDTRKKRRNSKSFKIYSKDKDWLENIRNIISPKRPIYNKKSKGKIVCFSLEISSNIIADWLISYGCVPNKSLTLSLGKEIPRQFLPDFIRGLIDGDGSIVCTDIIKKSNNIEYFAKNMFAMIVSGSKKFLDQLQILLTDSDIYCTVREKITEEHLIEEDRVIKRSVSYVLHFYNSKIYDFMSWIYYDDNLLCLNRKRNKAMQILEYMEANPHAKIKNGRKAKFDWPENEIIIDLISKMSNRQAAKIIGCSQSSLNARIKKQNIKNKEGL